MLLFLLCFEININFLQLYYIYMDLKSKFIEHKKLYKKWILLSLWHYCIIIYAWDCEFEENYSYLES